MERAYRGVGYVLFALPLVMVAGFWVPYFSGFPHFGKDVTPAVHVHALVQFTWVALAVAQPLAIGAGAYRTHRLLGRLSYFLAPLIVLFAGAMIVKEYGEHRAEGMSTAAAFRAEYLSYTVLPALAALYLLAIRRIRKGDAAGHMRYMICIAVALSPAGIGRVLGYFFDVRLRSAMTASLLLVDVAFLGLILYDRARGASPRPYAVALLTYLAIEAGWLALGRPA